MIAVSIQIVSVGFTCGSVDLGSISQVGNEFGAVEALWSQFEGVMAQEPEEPDSREGDEKIDEEEDGEAEQEDAGASQRERGR